MTPRAWTGLAGLAALVPACRDAAPAPRSPIASLEIQAADSFLLAGHARQLQVVARDAAGRDVAATTLRWRSASPQTALVDATGLVTAPDASPGGAVAVSATDTAGTAADTFVVQVVRHGWVKWRIPMGPMPLAGGPAQGPDGTVFVLGAVDRATHEATLTAVSPTGAVRWARRLAQVDLANYPVVGSDGTVFVVGQYVWAHAADGTLRWSITTRPVEPTPNLPDWHSGALASGGTLFAAMADDLFALDAATGDTLWVGPRATDGGWLLPPTISADGRTVYIKNTGDPLYAFDAATGAIRWAAPDPTPCCLSYGVGPAVAGSRILVPTFERMQELDTTGIQVGLGPTFGSGISEPAIAANGTLFVQRSNSPGIRAHNPVTTTLWVRQPESRWSWAGGPALARGATLYVAAFDGFYALEVADTGASVRWRYPADPADSLVFVGAPLIGPDGTVYTFTSCDFGREPNPCSDELIAFWEDKPVDPDSPWPMWRHDARRSGQAHK